MCRYVHVVPRDNVRCRCARRGSLLSVVRASPVWLCHVSGPTALKPYAGYVLVLAAYRVRGWRLLSLEVTNAKHELIRRHDSVKCP
eukprot:785157-Prymnesium_polylepis.1